MRTAWNALGVQGEDHTRAARARRSDSTVTVAMGCSGRCAAARSTNGLRCRSRDGPCAPHRCVSKDARCGSGCRPTRAREDAVTARSARLGAMPPRAMRSRTRWPPGCPVSRGTRGTDPGADEAERCSTSPVGVRGPAVTRAAALDVGRTREAGPRMALPVATVSAGPLPSSRRHHRAQCCESTRPEPRPDPALRVTRAAPPVRTGRHTVGRGTWADGATTFHVEPPRGDGWRRIWTMVAEAGLTHPDGETRMGSTAEESA